jgi:hypothetical protein
VEKQEIQLLVKSWADDPTSEDKFKQLLPIFFNILKRDESWNTLILPLFNQTNNTQCIN